jgi:hypothetical protein
VLGARHDLRRSRRSISSRQTFFFIGCGAVIDSLLPTIFSDYLGVSNDNTLVLGGASMLLTAVLTLLVTDRADK